MEDIVRAFNITYKDEATQVVNLKAGSWLFHATVKSGTPVYSIGLKDATGVWHNIDLSDQIVQGEWHDVEQVIETDYDIVEISLLNNVGTAQVLLPMLETGTKKSAKRPHVLDIEESAIVQSASWEIHTSTPVIYKDAPDAQTEGEHTPVIVTGRHWVGSVMTEEGFLTATADGDEEGIPVASPLILNAVNGKSSYTLRLYSDVDKTELLDYETIPIVFKGARGLNAIQVHLDNPIDSIPADKDGNALTMQGTGTLIRVFEGAEELFYDGAGETPSTYKVTAVATNIVMGSIGYANNTCTVQDAISMPAEKSKATIVYTVSGYTSDGYYFSLNVEQNFTKTNKGADGDGILAVIDYYGISTSASVLPATWYDYVPTKSENQFLWNYERIYYSDLTYDETQARVIQGKDARSIHDIKNAYAYSASDTVSPTSGWQYSLASLGTKPAGYFLWVREDIAYTDNPTNYISTAGYVVRDGSDGVSITGVDVEFAKNTSPTTAPTTGWTTTAPTLAEGEQLWTRTKTTYSAGNPTYSTPANITPKKGDTGAVGQGVESVTEEYHISSSKTTQPAEGSAGWSTTQPTWSQGQYIWSRVKVVYKNPASTIYTGYAVSSEWEAVNNLEIGGRNLLRGTSNEWITRTTTTSNYIDNFYKDTILEPNQTYTFSWEAELISGTAGGTVNIGSGSTAYQNDIIYSSVPILGKHSVTFTPTEAQLATHESFAFRWYNSGNVFTFRYKNLKLEKGTKATDWTPAPEDVQEEINSAKQEALTAANNVQTNVNNLNTYVDGAFKDGVIDEAEAKAIEKYLNSLNETKLSVDSSYSQLSNNEYLEGTAKTNLSSSKTALNTAYTNLVNSINTAIAGGSTTEAQKADVDAKFGLFNTAMAAYQVRVEEANKAIQNKLKSFSDEAMSKAGQADYLRAALQQSTEIDGGVVLGSVIAGRDASGQVRSYQNGDPDLNNTAFAAGVHDFGTEDETRTVGLNHDGSADIGVLRVTPEGKVVLIDPVTGLERLLFLEQDVPTAAYLMDAATDGGSQANPAQSGTDTFTLPNSMSVTSVNSTIAVVAAEMTLDATAGTILPMPDGTIPSARVSVTAELLRDGVYFASLGSTGLMFTSTGESGTNSTAINKTITGCPPGNYSVRLSVSTEGSIASRSFSISTSTMTWEGVKNVNWFQFGLNGFMAWFTNNAVHFDEQNGFFAKGKTDMPGVLASGSVSSTGGQSNVWGAKSNPAGAGAITGGRSVPLANMGHSNYVVMITPHTATQFRVGAKSNTSFQALGSGGFDYVVIGNNY